MSNNPFFNQGLRDTEILRLYNRISDFIFQNEAPQGLQLEGTIVQVNASGFTDEQRSRLYDIDGIYPDNIENHFSGDLTSETIRNFLDGLNTNQLPPPSQ